MFTNEVNMRHPIAVTLAPRAERLTKMMSRNAAISAFICGERLGFSPCLCVAVVRTGED